jgi:beta-galactosidase
MERLWSAESPKLYDVTLYVKHNRIITEYLNIKVGFGRTSHDGERIYRNGKAIDIKPAYYNAAETAKITEADIKRLKKEGKNTILVDYPQPWWFYDICDRVGIYVVDQANINTDDKGGDMSLSGTLANNPAWLGEFVQRQQATWWRSRRHPSVIAYSLGGPSGSGYNMYKCYEWMKSVEPNRPIVYSGGEWNSDLQLPVK